MKRSPLPKRTQPLARATKPLKRVPITKKPTRKAIASRRATALAKKNYFCLKNGLKQPAPCQRCERDIVIRACAAHHKIKRSLNGPDTLENLVIICYACHDWAHATPENLKAIRDSRSNAQNGEVI